MKKLIAKIKRHKKLTIAVVIALILLVGAYAFGFFDKKVERDDTPKKTYHSQLTGIEVEKDVSERPILGIMIENSQEARPQTGLDSAGIVFETTAEGGITRYLALYQEDIPAEVGPVRSIRAYFLDWAMGLDASIAHVGGSADALQMADDRDAKSLNQFKYSEPYYRTKSRAAPHNMYARTQDLQDQQRNLGYKKSKFPDIPRSDDSPSQSPDATVIAIDFSAPIFKTEFRYDQPTNSYLRFLAGKPHTDAVTNAQIKVKNLAVLKMSSPNINAIGEGEALVFKNGTVQKARWEQKSYKSRIKIIDEQGNEVPLNRGDTWFSAVPAGRTVTY